MKKQLIEFKQKEYNEKVNDLNKVIDTVNEAIPILVSNGIEPTFEVIKELFTNKKKFIQDRFIEETNKISDIVVVNRQDEKTKKLTKPIYTRDLFSRD